MNEAQVNGTQADEDRVEETQLNGDDAGDDGGVDVELLRRARLSAMLRELVRQEGKMEAAELLGVNYKTVARAEKSGRITGRMSDALERLLGPVDDPEAARLRERVGALEERMEGLEGGMEALAQELREGLSGLRTPGAGRAGGRAAVGDVEAMAEDEAQAQEDNGEGAGRSETRAAPPVAGLGSRKPFRERRLDPEIVTVEPAEDDAEVYGAAWPLVEEWRGVRAGHPRRGGSLSWLVTEERLLMLELAMLEEHGLTLPPEKQPLRGFGRRGQTSWRWKALADTRVALRKRKLLRWVRRVLTLWLWRK